MTRFVAVGAAAIFLGATGIGAAGSKGPGGCDRACLTAVVDQYVAAMATHNPARAPLARSLRYTENTGLVTIGEGLWVGASEAPTTFAIYVADPSAGQVGFFGVMKEFEKPVLLALRLKVENRQIVEIEHVVARDLRANGLINLAAPRPGLLASVAEADRMSRPDMLRIAASYYDSIEKSDGSLTPYADDCVRHENGMQTTSNRTPQAGPLDSAAGANGAFARIGALGCRDGMNTHILSYITRIGSRRVMIADEEKGLVFGLSMFHHKGNVRSIKVVGVPGIDTVPMDFGPIDLEAAHIFKISGGKMHEIEAMGFLLPYNSDSGWDR